MKEQIENLQKSFELSNQQIDDAINPLDVAALFECKNISYVLIGGHMLCYYEVALFALGELIYRGGGKELVGVANDVRLGKTISL